MSDDAALPLGLDDAPQPAKPAAYRVLARKYRPTTFAEMIGQDALVRTLTNAIASGRLAHAFVLTGVRGVGKTTTARILARALNCVGPDGKGGPTADPCGVCEPCRSILADSNLDVMEMDAASRTGVDDIREIIDGVRYGPVASRYKVYIIDEVHMLSKNAFNALLKTLEEPPPHVKFVFATTEIRKVPVTVLSRCQRFDLRRIGADQLQAYFTEILDKEGVAAEPEAVGMIARAADGSARDGLSLLDQAIAQGAPVGDKPFIAAAGVREMLGLADRSSVIDILEAAFAGEGPRMLEGLEAARRAGADPQSVLGDLLDFIHFVTRARMVPAVLDDPAVPEVERKRGGALAETISLPGLTRAWQTLLKGAGEVQAAPNPQAALEMVLIRLLYMSDMPSPGELVRKFGDLQSQGAVTAGPVPGPGPGGGARMAAGGGGSLTLVASEPAPVTAPSAPVPAPALVVVQAAPKPALRANPRTFEELVELAAARNVVLHGHLMSAVRLVHFEPGRLEFQPESAPPDLENILRSALRDWTGEAWVVSVSSAEGAPTLRQKERTDRENAMARAAEHPLVKAVLSTFPGAVIRDLRNPVEQDEGPLPGAEPAPDATDEEEPREA
ncbi:DNA polymerase III subunit gamma/tau [Mycobacterium sp. KBS0706]|uniref:DNA polymerase III subunit gamma/tau n=1 Tax=Mycobacterium sp. KBS0706 TaxID=2578109 RepID=UPI00110FC184|nr:DNA polymerase III subunit gamma/tau [Mycobacterium sp. KBS0706]TSD90427.1 DNA polymerase III subunit gamma/tau [Mycobacterium sp. KBS0706]